jgi:uncharacterized membrane protein
MPHKIFSKHTQWYWIIILIEASLGILLLLPEIAPFLWIRYVLGAIFVLYIPGYAIVRTLYARKPLGFIERNVLSIGLSLAVVPLIGFILDFTPWRIGLTAIFSTLIMVTTAVCTLALYQQMTNGSEPFNEGAIYTNN